MTRSKWAECLISLRMIMAYKLLRLLLRVVPDENPDGRIILYAILTATEKIKRNQ